MAVPNATKAEFLNGNIDLVNDTIKVLLLDDSIAYTFDADNDDYVADVTDDVNATEMSGTGYSRQTLANNAVTVDDTDNEGVFDADNVTFSSIDAGTIQAVVVYQEVTTDSDSPIVAVHDDDSLADLPLTTNGSNVTITWDAEGIINLG